MFDSSAPHEGHGGRVLLISGIVFLAAFMPLAFGAVHPWAYKTGEVSAFALLLMLWPFGRAAGAELEIQIRSFAIPIVVFLAFVLIQLTPFPPAVIHVLSPSTYRLYQQVFPGWPAQPPYAGLEASLNPMLTVTDAQTVVLPTVAEVKAGAPIPFAPNSQQTGDDAGRTANDARGGYSARIGESLSKLYSTRWRPISIAPVLTWSALILFAACGALFMLVAFVPPGAGAFRVERDRFVRSVLTVFVVVGLGLATLGLVEQATWNGKILWFFVPLDWGAPMPGAAPRASGPFVDPDHFAGLLAMIFPLAISGTLFRNPLVSARWSNGYRIACGLTSFLVVAAILMSQSRAGLLGLALGLTIVMVLASRRRERGKHAIRSRQIALAGAACMLVFALVFIGASGRDQVDARLQGTLSSGATFPGRTSAWSTGLRVVEDFPALGTGLRTWPELFALYSSPPWSELYFSEAHNDYLQLIAETGLVGLMLAGWFFLRAGIFIYRRFAQLSERILPIQEALVAGVVTICVIEFFDFDLQIPAIAFFLAMMLGLAVRIAWSWSIDEGADEPEQPRSGALGQIWAPGAVAAMLAATLVQPSIAYPYNLQQPDSASQAMALLLFYPANPFSHRLTIASLGDRMRPEDRIRQTEIAVSLDPTNPNIRDAYMRELARQGRIADALKQIELSVFNSPTPHTHPYMSDRILGWLGPDERSAIERGLKRARAEQVAGAQVATAEFYDALRNYREAASLYAEAAHQTRDPHSQYQNLLNAAAAASEGHDLKRAQSFLEQASAIEPDDPRAYTTLVLDVYEPQKDVAGIKRTIAQGIENGIDRYRMTMLLGQAAEQMGDFPSAIDALKTLLDEYPESFDLLTHLGELYLQNNDFNQAAIAMTKAVQLRPDSASAHYSLALADERAYNYADADKEYARAAQLAPENQSYRTRFAEFHKKSVRAGAGSDDAQTP